MTSSTIETPRALLEPSPLLDASVRPRDKKVRFESIDGLRGVACLMVLWFHIWYGAGRPVWPSLAIGARHLSLSRVFARGYGGVQLFFVLSGFCLSFPIFSKPDRAVNWAKYFVARIRRIVPPYWAALFLFGGISLIPASSHLHAFFGDMVTWPGTRRFILHGMLFWKTVLAGPFWTLVLEWRWYFLFPLCIFLCHKAGAWTMLALSIPLSALSMWLKFGANLEWTMSWTEGVFRYLPLFAFGMLASQLAVTGGKSEIERFLVRHCRWGVVLCLAILFAFSPNEQHSWQGTVQSTATFGPLAFFAVLAAIRDGLIGRLLAWRPLVWVGSFSYSLYLLHGPPVLAIGEYAQKHFTSPLALFVILMVMTPIATIGASYLFFLAFERPFLTGKPVTKATEAPQPTRMFEAAAP